MPFLSIIVPCRNERQQISECIQGLLAMDPPKGGFEILVADGQSSDGTREVLEQLARQDERLRIVSNPGLITPCGLNAAIRHARGDVLVRADAHTDYAPDYLLRCLEVLAANGADNVGGPARTMATGYRQRAIAAAYHSSYAVGGARFHDIEYEGPVDTVTYGCWPRATFDRFGQFDEELVRNQDDEHNLRIIRGGGKVYQSPKIRSWYHPRSSLGALFNQYQQYGYWKVRVIQKHRLPASIRHLVPGTFVLVILVLALLSVLSVAGLPTLAPASWLLLGLIGIYSGVTLLASVATARRTELRLLPVLPLVFACYHFGYGLGFLQGVWDFVIRRKGAGAWSTKLTRGESKIGSSDESLMNADSHEE